MCRLSCKDPNRNIGISPICCFTRDGVVNSISAQVSLTTILSSALDALCAGLAAGPDTDLLTLLLVLPFAADSVCGS